MIQRAKLAAASDQLFGVIGRLTTSGVLTTAALPLNDESSAITSGPDGNLWFTVSFAGASGTGVDSIGKITPGLSMTLYPLPSARFVSDGIVAGPDGALWFTEINGNGIGRITTSGLITQYPLPGAPNQTFGITVGADRALWFAYNVAGAGGYFVGSIGRITTSGLVSIYPAPAPTGRTASLRAPTAISGSQRGRVLGAARLRGSSQNFPQRPITGRSGSRPATTLYGSTQSMSKTRLQSSR